MTVTHGCPLVLSHHAFYLVCLWCAIPAFHKSPNNPHDINNQPRSTSNDERTKMHPAPSRLGLGMRQPMPSFGQGPSMGALAHQQQMMHHQQFPQPSKIVPVFIGSISGGISDAFLNDLLSVSDLRSSMERFHIFTTVIVLWSHTTIEATDNASWEAPRIWFL